MGNTNTKKSKYYNILTAKDVKRLQKKTNLTLSEIFDWHKKFLEKHPAGYIDKYDFISYYNKLEADSSIAKGNAKVVFKALDRDDNKKITFTEFLIPLSFFIHSDKYDPAAILEFVLGFYFSDGHKKVDKDEVKIVVEGLTMLAESNFFEYT